MTGDLTALLGGSAARFFLRHHPMFSSNPLCRLFGKQDYDRADGPRNLAFPVGPARRARKPLNAVS